MNISIREADLANSMDAAHVVDIIDSYAADPIGGGEPLSAEVRARLPVALLEHPTTLVLLALVDDAAVGVAVCFVGLSTFYAQRLLNIHDLAVLPAWRGKGVGKALLASAETRAVARGYCKLTLEVRDDNPRARALYERCGFTDFVLEAPTPTRFLCKVLA